MNYDERKYLATSVMLLSAVIAFFLAVLKYIVLIITNSVSIRLNFIDSCVDVFVSLINYFATVFSFRYYDKYPYGYDKITAFAAIFQIIILATFAYDSIDQAFSHIENKEAAIPSLFGVVIMMVSLLLTVILVYFQNKVIEKTHHLVVYADRMHYMTDLLTNCSMFVYFALIWIYDGDMTLFGSFDAYLAIILSFYILLCCIKVGISAWNTLMDARLCKMREEDIRSIALNTSRVLDAQIVSSRFSGVRECFEIMLTFPADLTIQESDEIISVIKLKLGDYIRCTILCTSKE